MDCAVLEFLQGPSAKCQWLCEQIPSLTQFGFFLKKHFGKKSKFSMPVTPYWTKFKTSRQKNERPSEIEQPSSDKAKTHRISACLELRGGMQHICSPNMAKFEV